MVQPIAYSEIVDKISWPVKYDKKSGFLKDADGFEILRTRNDELAALIVYALNDKFYHGE